VSRDVSTTAYLEAAITQDGPGQWRHAGRRFVARRFAGEPVQRLGAADADQLLRSVNATRPADVEPVTADVLSAFLAGAE
jgi:hypothetical protein